MDNKFRFLDRILLPALFFLMLFGLVGQCDAQDYGHHHNGRWHSHPHTDYHYHNNYRRPSVGYRPVITWIPSGTWMNVGPVTVSPDRRYVRMGINVGFSHISGYNTFNYRTGESRRYRR